MSANLHESSKLLSPGLVALAPGTCLRVDPVGEASLYWAQRQGAVWASADWDVLRAHLGHVEAINAEALHGYMCLSHVPTPHTLDPRIQSVPAGCALEVSEGGRGAVRRWQAWRESQTLIDDEGAALDTLKGLLRGAVQRALGATRGRVAVALSGGLDSSLVAALLVEAGCEVCLYTLDFGAPFNDELPFARQVAEHLRCPLRVVRAKSRDIDRALDAAALALQQPFGDGVVVPWYLLASAVRSDGFGALFTGEFGDQVFGGWANKPMIAATLYGDDDSAEGWVQTYLSTYHRFLPHARRLYTGEAQRRLPLGREGFWVRWALEAPGLPHMLHRLRAANFWLKGAQNIGPRLAQIARALGLGLHNPLADGSLADWSFSLSPDLLLKGACEKYLLKRAADPLLPCAIVWREKRGMGPPTTAWCTSLGWLRWRLRRMLSDRSVRAGELLACDYVRALRNGEPWTFDAQRSRRLGERLWLLLMLSVWAKAHDVSLSLNALPLPEVWGASERL